MSVWLFEEFNDMKQSAYSHIHNNPSTFTQHLQKIICNNALLDELNHSVLSVLIAVNLA